MKPIMFRIVALALLGVVTAGCVNQRYQAPAILALGASTLTTAGGVTMVAAKDNTLGRATAASLMAVGVAALMSASLWLGIRARCSSVIDCAEGETCQPVPTAGGQSYGVCVAAQ